MKTHTVITPSYPLGSEWHNDIHDVDDYCNTHQSHNCADLQRGNGFSYCRYDLILHSGCCPACLVSHQLQHAPMSLTHSQN